MARARVRYTPAAMHPTDYPADAPRAPYRRQDDYLEEQDDEEEEDYEPEYQRQPLIQQTIQHTVIVQQEKRRLGPLAMFLRFCILCCLVVVLFVLVSVFIGVMNGPTVVNSIH